MAIRNTCWQLVTLALVWIVIRNIGAGLYWSGDTGTCVAGNQGHWNQPYIEEMCPVQQEPAEFLSMYRRHCWNNKTELCMGWLPVAGSTSFGDICKYVAGDHRLGALCFLSQLISVLEETGQWLQKAAFVYICDCCACSQWSHGTWPISLALYSTLWSTLSNGHSDLKALEGARKHHKR